MTGTTRRPFECLDRYSSPVRGKYNKNFPVGGLWATYADPGVRFIRMKRKARTKFNVNVCSQCGGNWVGTGERCGYWRRSRWCSRLAGYRWRYSRCSSSSSRTWSSQRTCCTRCSRSRTWWPCRPRVPTRCCTVGWTRTSDGTYRAYAGRCGTAATRNRRPGANVTRRWPRITAVQTTGGSGPGPRCRVGGIITTPRQPGCRSWWRATGGLAPVTWPHWPRSRPGRNPVRVWAAWKTCN